MVDPDFLYYEQVMKHFDEKLEGTLWRFKDNSNLYKFSLYSQPTYSSDNDGDYIGYDIGYDIGYESTIMLLGNIVLYEDKESVFEKMGFEPLKFYKAMVTYTNGDSKTGWITSHAIKDLSPLSNE